VARLALAPEVLDDLDRLVEHMEQFDAEQVDERIAQLLASLDILTHSPLIGRPAPRGKRELVIGKATRGFVALYRYVDEVDTVFVLAVRSQREAGYKHD
jgi:toxin ParE1/3/4